jgi:hypothetical protein
MAMTTRMAGEHHNLGHDQDNGGGRRQRGQGQGHQEVMAMATRVAGNKEGKGGKAMVMATRVAGK